MDLYGEATWSTSGGKEADLELLAASKAHCRFCLEPVIDRTFRRPRGREKAIQEMARVVRPGGIVAVATEWLLLEEYSHPEFFNRSEVMKYLVEASGKLELISPIDFHTLTYEYLVVSIVYPAGIRRLRRRQVQSTPIFLFLRVLA